MRVITRHQFLEAIEPDDWSLSVGRVRLYLTITFDEFINAVLLDDMIALTPKLMSRLEIALRSRPLTLANLRRLT